MKTLNNNLALQPAWAHNELTKMTTTHTTLLNELEEDELGYLKPVGTSSYRRWGCLDFWECWSEMRYPMAVWIGLMAVAAQKQARQP